MADRCMGNCCEDIGLDVSPETLKQEYGDWLEALHNDLLQSPRKGKWHQPIYLVFPMLRFIGTGPHHEWEGYGDVYHYNCVHFDKKKRVCGIYEHRPEMCRRHGTRYICKNPNCEWAVQIRARALKAKDVRRRDDLVTQEKKEEEKNPVTNRVVVEDSVYLDMAREQMERERVA